MPSMTRDIKPNTPLHNKLLARLASRIKMAEKEHTRKHDRWRRNEEAVLAYIPVTEEDRVRKLRRDGGQPTYTNIVVPYSYGMLMTAHTYITSVFLGRNPVHQYAGRHGESEQQTLALEALVGYQVDIGQMLAPYYVWFYDALKYGIGIMAEYWDDQTIAYGFVEEVVDPITGKPTKVQAVKELPGYKGNKLVNISPYDWMPDPRVSAGNYQKGEFCVWRKAVMWGDLVRRSRQGYYTESIKQIQHPGNWGPMNSEPNTGSVLSRPEDVSFSDIDATGKEFKHPAFVRLYEVYVDLIPKEWELGESEYPQKWVFTITADKSLILGASPHGAMHGQFPFAVTECEIEEYGSYNRGIPEVLEGLQQTMDWLVNSHFWNVRQTLNNQFLVDPSRVIMKDVQKGGAGFIWRARPEAYGSKMADAVHQIPVQDMTGQHLNDTQAMFALGERTIGISEQMMGAGPPGGRVTATATRTSAGFGINRLKTIAEYMSAASFMPHSLRLVSNTQQYYDAMMKLRVAGDLVLDAGMGFLDVGPDSITGAYNFVPVDGTLPIDRFAQATLWKDMMSQIAQIPQIAMGYDWGRIFGYVAQLAGIKNINKFKIQLSPMEQIISRLAAGNLIPMNKHGSGLSGSSSSTAAGGPSALPSPGSPQDTLGGAFSGAGY